MPTPNAPFKILALAPFKMTGGKPWTNAPLRIDKENVAEVMQELGIALYVHLPQDVCPAGGIDIRCSKPKDFHPDGMLRSIEFLKNLSEAGKFIDKAGAEGMSPERIEEGLRNFPGIPPLRIEPAAKKPPRKDDAGGLDDLLNMVALPGEDESSPPSYSKPAAQIQASFRRVFHDIFDDDDFRRVEAAWRGVSMTLAQGGVGDNVSLEIVPVDSDSLEDTLSALTPELVRDLPSMIVLDLPFDNSARSLELLDAVATFSETLMVPTAVWITRKFFLLDSWEDLKKLSYIPHLIDEPNYAKWRTLRGTSKAHWLCATCNRFLTRYPFGPENRPRSVDFREPKIPWTSPVWAFATLAGQSAEKFGWPTRLSDYNEIRLQDLPLHTIAGKKPMTTELYLTEDRIQQFLRSGITPLVSQKGADIAFVPAETTVAGESLCYQLFLTAVTQFIIWCQDNLSSALEPGELEQSLKNAAARFFEKGGFDGAEHLEIKTGPPAENNRIPVHFSIKPKRRVLTSGRKVEMDILW